MIVSLSSSQQTTMEQFSAFSRATQGVASLARVTRIQENWRSALSAKQNSLIIEQTWGWSRVHMVSDSCPRGSHWVGFPNKEQQPASGGGEFPLRDNHHQAYNREFNKPLLSCNLFINSCLFYHLYLKQIS